MRIVEPTLAMFLNELAKLDPLQEQVLVCAEKYLHYKKDKMYGATSAETKYWRNELEMALTRFKAELSRIYDVMHDRGLTNFESGFNRMNLGYYFPMKIWQDDDRADDLLFEQIIGINPLATKGLENYESTLNAGRDRSIDSEEAARTENDGQSTTDLQSIGVTTAYVPSSETGESDDVSREEVETYVPDVFVFPR